MSVALSQVEALARGGENRVVAETIFVLGLSSNNLSTSSAPSDMHTSRDSSTKVPPENAQKSNHNVHKYCEYPITRYSFRSGNPLFYSARLLRTFPYLVLDMTLLVSFVVMIHLWQVWVLINWQQQWKIFQRCWTDSLEVTSYSQACGPMQGEGPHQKYVQ